MRLESVSLFGFKSFADRTEVKILPGITAIVGPNGCGKTNIADALRWALGEQSPKALRGHRMEDVIFHGSASRPALGLAEVLLTFSNDGEVAVPWSEISVGRRLYRDGESEYLLNKATCRLKDVHDLFLGTGVNPKAYALIEQERLGQILSGRPLDRRVFIEEAAGITRYKQQRGETLAKLEATRQNLLRVRDVMDEVKRQLASLERQAKKAQAYKRLHGERRRIELSILATEHAKLVEEEALVTADEATAGERADRLRTRVATLGAALEVARTGTMAAEHRVADLRRARERAELEFEGCVTRVEQLRSLERDLTAETGRLTEEAEGLRLRLRSLGEERATKEALAIELRRELGSQEARATAEEEALEAIRGQLRAQREMAEARRRDQVKLAGRRSEVGQVLGGLEERRGQLQRRLERLEAERLEADAERNRLLVDRAEVEARLGEAARRLAELESRLAQLAAQTEAASGERTGALDAAEACRVMLAARRSSLVALEELEAQRAGYSLGVQAVFAAAREVRLSGVVGTVADLLDVPRELECAVEAALGQRLEWVVMDTFRAAKDALSYLGENAGGQATFLPLDWLNGGPEAHVPSEEGVVGVASALVGSPHPALVANLLGSIVVVRDLGAAERLWSGNGVDTSFVTVAGEVLSPPGALGGGRPSGAGNASLLARKRAIRDLTVEVGEVARSLAVAEERTRSADALLGELGATQRAAAIDREAAEADRLTAAKDLEQVRREADRVDLLVEACGAELAQLIGEAAGAEAEIEGQRRELLEIGAAAEHAGEEVSHALAAIEAGQAEEAARSQSFLDLQVHLAGLAGRIRAAEAEGERILAEAADARERLAAAEVRLATLGARVAEGRSERADVEERAEVVRRARDEAQQATQAAGNELETLTERVRALAEETRDAEGELGRVTQAAHAVTVRLAEIRVRRQDLEADARRQFEVTPAALRADHDPQQDLAVTRARLEGVMAKISALEPVNLVADEEYRDLDERLAFLRTQHDDLMASIKDLDRALRGMTRTAQERFDEAFQAINRNFQEIFGRLFEGGRAELRLVDALEEGDPLDTGIEMVAQPRGKRLQAISLLSGGEKALTGLALLFAIFYYRPSPFCLLDEVDAPLDDANISRFTRILRELAAQTQFVVITHNRKTMEAADALYGITMETPGLSRVVSVNLA